MNRIATFLGFSIYQLILFAIVVPIALYIIYGLTQLMPGMGISERGPVEITQPTFSEWLNGSGDNLGVLNGDFGMSFRTKKPVGELINQRLPATLELVGFALLFSLLIGIPLAIVLAMLRHNITDGIPALLVTLAGSIPVFCLALLLILRFSIQERVFPMGGRCGIADDCDVFANRITHLILPVASLTIVYASGIAAYVRDGILRFSRQEGARLTFRQIIAGVFVFTPAGIFGTLVGMASSIILIEGLFAFPGVGRLVLDAGSAVDTPMLTGLLVTGVLAISAIYLIAMLFYGLMMALFPTRPAEMLSDDTVPEISPLRQRLRTLSSIGAFLAALIVIGIAVVAFTSSGDATQSDMQATMQPPSVEHPWGTDRLGRDFQARVLQGGQTPLFNAAMAGGIAIVLTFILGVIGGLFGGAVGAVLNIPLNIGLMVLQTFPLLLLLIVLMTIFRNASFLPLWLAVLSLPQTVPVVRTTIQSMRNGVAIPLLAVVVYVFAVVMARAVLVEAMLDFIGFGVQPPTPTWGSTLSDAMQTMTKADYLLTPPIALLTLTLFCLTIVYVRLYDSFGFLLPVNTPKAKRGEKLFDDVKTDERDSLFADVK